LVASPSKAFVLIDDWLRVIHRNLDPEDLFECMHSATKLAQSPAFAGGIAAQFDGAMHHR
jgi:hypothetical protein